MSNNEKKPTIITIARGYGSGGRTLGKHLAKELGIAYYDKEILKMASDDSGINEELFAVSDEEKTSTSLFRGNYKYTGEVIPPGKDGFVSRDNLFDYQAKIIRELAEKESCIFVGHCADYILKNYDNVIKLYFYASIEDCVVRLQRIYGEPEKDLIKKIEKTNKYRSNYYKYYTGRDWDNAGNYDLCLNTSSTSYEKLVEIVKAYLAIARAENETR